MVYVYRTMPWIRKPSLWGGGGGGEVVGGLVLGMAGWPSLEPSPPNEMKWKVAIKCVALSLVLSVWFRYELDFGINYFTHTDVIVQFYTHTLTHTHTGEIVHFCTHMCICAILHTHVICNCAILHIHVISNCAILHTDAILQFYIHRCNCAINCSMQLTVQIK